MANSLQKYSVVKAISSQIRDLHERFARFVAKTKYSILLDTTNSCNLSCTFCTRTNSKARWMTVDEVHSILGKIHSQVNDLQLSCAWEYSIAKHAPEIIRAIGQYQITSTKIYTNGNILTSDIAGAVIDAKIGDFVVSLGEAKRETYENIRGGAKFDLVVANIKKIADLKNARRALSPRICTNLTVMNHNIDELLDYVDMAQAIGVQRIIGRHLILNKGLSLDNEQVRDKERVNGIIAAAEKKALAYGMSFSIPTFEHRPKPKQCRAPWQQLYISSNGDVSVCPRIHKYVNVGNLLTQKFSEVVNNQTMRTLKAQFKTLDFQNPVCGICNANQESEIAIDQGF